MLFYFLRAQQVSRILPTVKPRGARSLKQISGDPLHSMVRKDHDRTTITCSDLDRSFRDRNTRKSLDAMPRLYLVWGIWLSKPIRESRRADSNRSGVAGVYTALQIPHIQQIF